MFAHLRMEPPEYEGNQECKQKTISHPKYNLSESQTMMTKVYVRNENTHNKTQKFGLILNYNLDG